MAKRAMHKLQQVLLPTISIPPTAMPVHVPRILFDGCSKGNPGPAGAGAHILMPVELLKFGQEGPPGDAGMRQFDRTRDVLPEFREVWGASAYLGERTNNEAEYRGLILGLNAAVQRKHRRVDVFGDSLVVINQMKGLYKVKAENLVPLYEAARSLCARFDRVTFTHVLRAHNKRADALANEALAHCDRREVA